MSTNKFGYVAVGVIVGLLGLAKLWFPSAPTQEEVDQLMVAMPALVKDDFARHVKGTISPDGIQWAAASVIHSDVPFEDWYGLWGAHSLKMDVVVQRQDGAKFTAMYKVSVDDQACTKQPKSCASVSGLLILQPKDQVLGEAGSV